jgi:hypothetical protein
MPKVVSKNKRLSLEVINVLSNHSQASRPSTRDCASITSPSGGVAMQNTNGLVFRMRVNGFLPSNARTTKRHNVAHSRVHIHTLSGRGRRRQQT